MDPQSGDDLERAAPENGSLLEALRAKRDTIQAEDELVLDVAPYDNRVAIRFKFPEGGWAHLRAIGRKTEQSKDPLAELYGFARSLAAACDEILGRNEAGDLVPLDPDPDAPPLRFNARLAELLGIDVPDEVRDKTVHIVRHFYSPQAQRTGVYRGDVSLTGHAVRLAEWFDSSSTATDEAFVGE